MRGSQVGGHESLLVVGTEGSQWWWRQTSRSVLNEVKKDVFSGEVGCGGGEYLNDSIKRVPVP